MKQRKGEERPKSFKSRRFMRGAQVPDVDKLVAAKQRKAMRKRAESRQAQKRIASFFKSLTGIILAIILLLLVISRLFIFDISVDSRFQSTVDNYFDGSQYRRFKPAFNPGELASRLQQNHPEIASVDVSAPLVGNSLSLEVMERQEAVVWTDFSRAKTYIVDQNGVAYEVNQGTPRTDLPEIRDRSGIAVELGSLLIAPGTIDFMQRLATYLSDESLALQYFVPGEAPQDVQVELNNRPYYLLLTTTRPLSEQIEQLDKFLSSRLSRGVGSYIDLRVTDKVFYK